MTVSSFGGNASTRSQELTRSNHERSGNQHSRGRHHTGRLVADVQLLNFGNVGVGSTATEMVIMTNMDSTDVTLTNVSVSPNCFSVSELSLPETVAPGKAVSFRVEFTPQAAGVARGMMVVDNNAIDAMTNLELMGEGAQGRLSASPTVVDFGSVTMGAGATQNVVVTNAGTATLNLTQATISGAGFGLSGLTLPMLIVNGQSAAFSLNFNPESVGSASGSLTLTTNGPATEMEIPLAGAGVTSAGSARLVPTASTVSFGNVTDGSSSSQTIRLANSGSGSLTISSASVSGSGFGISRLSTPLTLTPGQTTTFNAVFAPQSAGSMTGSITLGTDAMNSPSTTITLSGTGVTPALQLTADPSALNFGNVNVAGSGSQSVTLTNSGNSSVTISTIIVSGLGFSENNVGLPATLLPGQTLTVTTVFAPKLVGGATGSLSVNSTASNSPVVALSGTGMQSVEHSAALSWSGSTPGVAGYNVYRGTTMGGPYTKLNMSLDVSTGYTDDTVQLGGTYFYVVTAVDSSGNESTYSSEARAVIP